MKKKILIAFIIYFLILKYMFSICFPFLLALIFYYMLKPIIDRLEKHFDVCRNALGVSLLLVIYFLFAFLLGLLFTGLIIIVVKQMQLFPYYYQQYLLPLVNEFSLFMHSKFSIFMNQDYSMLLKDFLGQSLIVLVNMISSFLTSIPTFLISFFIFFISTFFLVLEYEDIKQKIISFTSFKHLQILMFIKNKSYLSLKSYFKCQMILMMICFGILCLTFSILKINHVLWSALMISLLDALPFIGVGIALIPMCLLYFIEGQYLNMIYILLIYFMINMIRSLLEPHLMNKELKIPSFILLLSMVIHVHFFGMIGIILSPIHMNLLYSMLDYES